MAQERKITAHFESGKRYFENSIGAEFNYTSFTGPYEYLLGALAGCFNSTLDSLERASSWESVTIKTSGIKRETVPTTLECTTLDISVVKATDKAEFETLAKKASEMCSIFQTIGKVSEMKINISYED